MNKLIIQEKTLALTLDSREVAKMVGKNHKELLRDIRTYEDYLGESNFALTDFFIESTYISNQNKELPNYQITKKGCEFIAHKLTGQKGTLFTATYINKFHEMEKQTKNLPTQRVENHKQQEIDARLKNARAREANILLKIAEKPEVPKEYKQVLYSHASQIIVGRPLLPLPKTERTYTAGDIAEELGTTANMVGRIANKNNLKTDEYGINVWDKSRYSSKQVQSWQYNEKGKDKLIEIFRKDMKANVKELAPIQY